MMRPKLNMSALQSIIDSLSITSGADQISVPKYNSYIGRTNTQVCSVTYQHILNLDSYSNLLNHFHPKVS